jgi:hypothetical protein
MSEATAQSKSVFWQSNWGRALYFSVAIAGSIAYIMLLLFLVNNSMINQSAFYLGEEIFWIPYLFLLFLAPSKNKKETRTSHKVLPYMLLNAAVCVTLMLLTYYLVSNSIIATLDYNFYIFIITAAFYAISMLMVAVVELKDWLAKRKMLKHAQELNPLI